MIIYLIIGIIFVIIVILFFIANYLYNIALNPHKDKTRILNASHNLLTEDTQYSTEKQEKWFYSMKHDDVYIDSYDKLKLHAYTLKNKLKTNKWVIIVHGYFGNAEQIIPAVPKFYEFGYNILMVDARGHGKSEGNYIGMGWHDRLDIISWIDYLEKKYNKVQIVLFGVSMGAATVCITSGEKLSNSVKAIISDCGYTSLIDEFSYQAKALFNIPSFPIINILNIITKMRAGYSLKDVDSIRQLQKATVPILFIHGDKDTFVPIYMLDQLYEATLSKKEKLIIKEAGHGASHAIGHEIYWKTINDFISKYID